MGIYAILDQAAEAFKPTLEGMFDGLSTEREKNVVVDALKKEQEKKQLEMKDPFLPELFREFDQSTSSIKSAIESETKADKKGDIGADDVFELMLLTERVHLESYFESNNIKDPKEKIAKIDAWVDYLDFTSRMFVGEEQVVYSIRIAQAVSALKEFRREFERAGLEMKQAEAEHKTEKEMKKQEMLVRVANQAVKNRNELPEAEFKAPEKVVNITNKRYALIQIMDDYIAYLEEQRKIYSIKIEFKGQVSYYTQAIDKAEQMRNILLDPNLKSQDTVNEFIKNYNQHCKFLSQDPSKGFMGFYNKIMVVLEVAINKLSFSAAKEVYGTFFNSETSRKKAFLNDVSMAPVEGEHRIRKK